MIGRTATLSNPLGKTDGTSQAATNVVNRARDRLGKHAEIWSKRPLVRDIYRGYHQMLRDARSTVAGRDLEVGGGHGSFAGSSRGVISCDLVPCGWLDCAADAMRLPFRDGSLANLILIDVLHHLQDPARFFEQAQRTLAPGGRILMIEPYTSPVSWLAWRFVHDEDIDMSANPLENLQPDSAASKDPWHANTAIPTLLFFRDRAGFDRKFPNLRVVARSRFDLLLYPLSGGFERRRLIPHFLAPAARLGEQLLKPLAPLLAFRCFVVVEKVR